MSDDSDMFNEGEGKTTDEEMNTTMDQIYDRIGSIVRDYNTNKLLTTSTDNNQVRFYVNS